MTERIVPLDATTGPEAGGKAFGLSRLIDKGLRIPPGFVVLEASADRIPEDLDVAYLRLGRGAVAVRSSALGEDGSSSSFAGQLDTVLGVEGERDLRRAIARCAASLQGDRVRAYRRGPADGDGRGMAVVVQQMVDARTAGVLFTADPVTSDRSRIVIDAVAGLGDALVSGHTTPDRFVTDRRGRIVEREPADDIPVLSEGAIETLARQALEAEAAWGDRPLDLEWAIDGEGTIFWLQARPITTLADEAGELDSVGSPTDVYTTANIGEMMPGAVDPLTLTTTFWAVDQALQEMQASFGALTRLPEFVLIQPFHGHLFFDMTRFAECGRHVAGQSPDTLALAICGRHVPEITAGPKSPWPTLLRNAALYVRYVLTGPADLRRFEPHVASFRVPERDGARETYEAIVMARAFLFDTTNMHLHSSAGSGALIGLIQGLLTRGAPPTLDDESALIGMLANTTGVESAELVSDFDAVVDAIAAEEDRASEFAQMSVGDAASWLAGQPSGDAGEAYTRFLERHGHRAYREADLRQPSWRDQPAPLIASMQAAVASRRSQPRPAHDRARSGETALHGRVPEWLVRYARSTVRNRERSKSMMIAVVDQLKVAYRRLAAQLVGEGLLDDEDLLYFLTHREIGRLLDGDDPSLRRKALARRRAFPALQALEFEDIHVGPPRPIDRSDGEALEVGQLIQGRPASQGTAEGTARVVRTLDEVAGIEAGDILVAPVTDVGWTPYFGLIGGLATDVGSPISHGAVVAREYGLPAVVNLRRATRVVKTGDRVVLDGTRGTLRIVSR